MRQKLHTSIVVFALVSAVVIMRPRAVAQHAAPVSLHEQLAAQYKLVTMGSDSNGVNVVQPGTLLAVQKGGIISVPWKALAVCPAKFQDNSLHPSAGFCAAMVRSVSKFFQNGDKVYPTKIDVNVEKEKITFAVVACDACSGTNPPTSYKGEVVFQFPKGYLETASAAAVEDTIGQVFTITDESQQDAQANPPVTQPEQAAPVQAAETQKIQLGQTPDQVQSAFGKPEKIVDLGAKQIYVYRDLKVTFLNGKVSDVQ